MCGFPNTLQLNAIIRKLSAYYKSKMTEIVSLVVNTYLEKYNNNNRHTSSISSFMPIHSVCDANIASNNTSYACICNAIVPINQIR